MGGRSRRFGCQPDLLLVDEATVLTLGSPREGATSSISPTHFVKEPKININPEGHLYAANVRFGK